MDFITVKHIIEYLSSWSYTNITGYAITTLLPTAKTLSNM